MAERKKHIIQPRLAVFTFTHMGEQEVPWDFGQPLILRLSLQPCPRHKRGMPAVLRPSLLLALGAFVVSMLLPGCRLLEDNGTHLAYALERGAHELQASGRQETIVRYQTLDAAAVPYYIEIAPSGPAAGRWGSYLVVSGQTPGGTSYHNRFVFVPHRLYLQKSEGGPTEVTLRQEAGRIEVIGLR